MKTIIVFLLILISSPAISRQENNWLKNSVVDPFSVSSHDIDRSDFIVIDDEKIIKLLDKNDNLTSLKTFGLNCKTPNFVYIVRGLKFDGSTIGVYEDKQKITVISSSMNGGTAVNVRKIAVVLCLSSPPSDIFVEISSGIR